MARAVVVHAIPGRARLRVEERRGDAAWFACVEAELARTAQAQAVAANAATASLLIEYHGALDALLEHAAAQRLFRVDGGAAQGAAARSGNWMDELEPRLARLLRGELDRQSGVALALAALGALQVARGRVLPAGVSMLTEAYKLLFGAGPAAPDADAGDDRK